MTAPRQAMDVRDWAGWQTIVEDPGRAWLEGTVLPAFVAGQRWFGGRTRRVRSMTLADAAPLADDRAVLALVGVAYEDGGAETYVLPLAVAADAAGRDVQERTPGAVIATFDGSAPAWVLYDGSFDPDVRRTLLAMIRESRTIATWNGQIAGHAGHLLPELLGPDPAGLPSRLSGAEQSNTSIRYGDRLMLKVFRRPSEGANPEREMTECLTDRTRFRAIARFGGSLEYRRSGRADTTLALLQAFVPNEGDAWAWTLQHLGTFFEQTTAAGQDPGRSPAPLAAQWLAGEIPSAARSVVGEYLPAAAKLGRRTAELHAALAHIPDDPAFAVDPAGPRELADASEAMLADGVRVLDALAAHLDRVPPDAEPLAREILRRRQAIGDVIDALRRIDVPVPRTRIHGDYHLGQVLVTRGDFVIVDFEGEPARSLAERRAKHSPVKDVAGMLRSFCYAAEVGRRAALRGEASSADWARVWEAAAGAAFLSSYLEAAEGQGMLPTDREVVATLLRAYLLDKALYELRYELDNRPAWVGIPLRGVLALGV